MLEIYKELITSNLEYYGLIFHLANSLPTFLWEGY